MSYPSRNREQAVSEFQTAFGQPVNTKITKEALQLRMKLLTEEYHEVLEAVRAISCSLERDQPPKQADLENLLQELADVQYVLSGFAVTFGLPLGLAFNRVHESNMSKLGEDGKPIYREDGKVLKGPNYHKPTFDDLV